MTCFFSLGGFWQTLAAASFAYAMTALGAALVFFSKRMKERAVSALTGAAAGIMIAASFFSLLLPALSYGTKAPSAVLTIGFLSGGILIVVGDLILEKWSETSGMGAGKGRKCLLLYSAVTLHNVPEGLAIGVAFGAAAEGGAVLSALMFAAGIGIQNFPEGMCVAYPLREMGYSAKKSFFLSQLSGFVELLFALIGFLWAGWSGIMPWVLSFSAGAMLAVVCSELIPECFSGDKVTASLGVILGFSAMMLLDLLF